MSGRNTSKAKIAALKPQNPIQHCVYRRMRTLSGLSTWEGLCHRLSSPKTPSTMAAMPTVHVVAVHSLQASSSITQVRPCPVRHGTFWALGDMV